MGQGALTLRTTTERYLMGTTLEESQRTVEMDPEEPVRDTSVRGWGTDLDEIGAADLASAARMARCEGRGHHAKNLDSRLNLGTSRIGSRPWTGGDVTSPLIPSYSAPLSAYSSSSETDSAVDTLPMLFLAYCTMTQTDYDTTSDDR
jgi:hypothetical protein